jgi:uncharacterized membrane protein YidH (DUF202 family)
MSLLVFSGKKVLLGLYLKMSFLSGTLQQNEPRGLLNLLKSSALSHEIPVNPKGHFANERTFLHWMSMNLIIGGLGIGLINFGNKFAQISGVVFMGIVLYFSMYSLIQYHKRADLLAEKAKGARFEDINGVLAMVVVIFVGVMINFILNFIS